MTFVTFDALTDDGELRFNDDTGQFEVYEGEQAVLQYVVLSVAERVDEGLNVNTANGRAELTEAVESELQSLFREGVIGRPRGVTIEMVDDTTAEIRARTETGPLVAQASTAILGL